LRLRITSFSSNFLRLDALDVSSDGKSSIVTWSAERGSVRDARTQRPHISTSIWPVASANTRIYMRTMHACMRFLSCLLHACFMLASCLLHSFIELPSIRSPSLAPHSIPVCVTAMNCLAPPLSVEDSASLLMDLTSCSLHSNRESSRGSDGYDNCVETSNLEFPASREMTRHAHALKSLAVWSGSSATNILSIRNVGKLMWENLNYSFDD